MWKQPLWRLNNKASLKKVALLSLQPLRGSDHHLPLSVEDLIGMLARNPKLVFILNACLWAEKFKHNRSRALQVERDRNKWEYNILHCIARRFYFWLFIGVRKWENFYSLEIICCKLKSGCHFQSFEILLWSWEITFFFFSHVMAVNLWEALHTLWVLS